MLVFDNMCVCACLCVYNEGFCSEWMCMFGVCNVRLCLCGVVKCVYVCMFGLCNVWL